MAVFLGSTEGGVARRSAPTTDCLSLRASLRVGLFEDGVEVVVKEVVEFGHVGC